jgi:2-methylisocitrate lyase-like PEP mutase family enzyme
MATLAERAEKFRDLHRRPRLFVLPNAWDVASARVFEDAGFPAVATSSAGAMVSLGYPDGEGIPRPVYLAAVRRIAAKVTVPLSVDAVAGFASDAAGTVKTVREIVAAGGAGINLEDLDPVTETLRPLDAQLERLRAIRAFADGEGIPLVINARTDALAHGPGGPEDRFREAVRRARAFREAGADCVYPMRLVERDGIARFLAEVPGPVNVMIRPGLPPLDELERLGVRRVSFGPAASYAALGLLRRVAAEILGAGRFDALLDGALTFDELNDLARPAGAPPRALGHDPRSPAPSSARRPPSP